MPKLGPVWPQQRRWLRHVNARAGVGAVYDWQCRTHLVAQAAGPLAGALAPRLRWTATAGRREGARFGVCPIGVPFV